MPLMSMIYTTVILEILFFGPGFLVVAFVMFVLSSMIGEWTACQIRQLDAVINGKIARVKGRHQPSNVSDYCRLVKNAAKFGPVCPPLALIIFGVGAYCAWLAGDTSQKKVNPFQQIDIEPLPEFHPSCPAFTAPGRMEFR